MSNPESSISTSNAALDENTSIEVLQLSRRAHNSLRRAGINTIMQLTPLDDEELLLIRNLGVGALDEIKQKLGDYLDKHPKHRVTPEKIQNQQPSQPPPPPSALLDEDIPVEALQLSARACNSLRRAGIHTLTQLAALGDEDILALHQIGDTTLAEIKQKLDVYLINHPEHQIILDQDQRSLRPSPHTPLVDPELLTLAIPIPLNKISVERLALPIHKTIDLYCLGIDSIGVLIHKLPLTFSDIALVRERLVQYLNWIVEQDVNVWKNEVTGKDANPLHELSVPQQETSARVETAEKDIIQLESFLSETTLDELVQKWLDCVDERERQVLHWRFDSDQALTLEEIGQRMDVSRERARQIQQRAQRKLSTPTAYLIIAPLLRVLVQMFIEAGGLMSEDKVRENLVDLVRVEEINPTWVTRLLLHACKEFQKVPASDLWGLADKPLSLVSTVNQKLIELLRDADAPISPNQLVSDLIETFFILTHETGLDDPFVAACLRTNQEIRITDEMCTLHSSSPVPHPPQQEQLRIELEGQAVSDTPPATLEEWEHYLRAQIGQVELLGEIPISDQERAQLGKVIGLRVRALGHSRAIRTLRSKYPCAFVVYLVAQGVYGYQGGDYWTEVVQVTGLHHALASQVGQVFEEILEALDLPLFYDMRAESHRYVSLILAHGGIPNYCLPDFFSNMLQPSVLRAQYADMTAAELIDEWGWRSSIQSFTDKPVLHFMAYGDQVARNFVERCREMAWETLDTGIVPDAENVGLPKRVVDAYRRWITEQGADQVQRDTTDRWRLRKPQVLVDPWGEGLILDLPPQQVPATMIYADIVWQVRADEEAFPPIPVRVRRTGFDLKTEADSLALSQPAAIYEVSLLADDQVKRTWRYQGVDDEQPLLTFDPERGTLLPWQHSLPARHLGLLYPTKLDLRVEGDAELVEELPRMPWGWASFCGETWDLKHSTRLVLLREGEQVLAATLRPDESRQRPQMVGGALFSAETLDVQAPVYVGTPPAVQIPLRLRTGQEDLSEELTRWRLTVRNKWSAVPEIRTTTTLADLRPQLTVSEKHALLPLSLPSLLGEAPCGNFLVRLRGPLGRDAEFTLRVLPHLQVSGHEALYLPDGPDGPQPVKLLVETSPDDGLDCHSQEDECHIQVVERRKDRWVHEVRAGPDVTRVELTVTQPSPTGDTVRVPIPVSIRRLRWALVGEQTGASRKEWTGHILKRPVDALLQIQSPCLLIALPLAAPIEGQTIQARLELRLLDVDNAELQVETAAPPPRGQSPQSRGQRLWRFDLSAFLDTVRASRSPILRLELVAWNLPGQDESLRLPVLSLTRTLVVDDVELALSTQNPKLATLNWCETVPLKNRHVRFWSLWRPWEPVLERPIPDEAEGALSVDLTQATWFPGQCRVEFLVVDPWVEASASLRPPQGTPSTADIELVSPTKQLQLLNTRLQKEPRFELFLERAVIYQDTGNPREAQADRQWCYEHLDDGTVPQIIALIELARAADDQNMLRPLQLKMFAARRVKSLFLAHSQGEIPSEYFQAYLDNLPRSGLLPEATCKQLLEAQDERARLHAVQQLIRRKAALGVDTVLEWIDAAALSDADAMAILALNANYAVECLRERADRSAARRLLEVLSQTVEDAIHVGDWVHCDLGWGRIEQIEKLDTGAQVRWCVGKQSRHKLTVALHPNVDPEMIVIDLPSSSAAFVNPGIVMICSECDAFSTQKYPLMEQHFEAVHRPRTKKEIKERGEKYRKFQRLESMPAPINFLEFSSEQPPYQWL